MRYSHQSWFVYYSIDIQIEMYFKNNLRIWRVLFLSVFWIICDIEHTFPIIYFNFMFVFTMLPALVFGVYAIAVDTQRRTMVMVHELCMLQILLQYAFVYRYLHARCAVTLITYLLFARWKLVCGTLSVSFG